MKRVAKRTATQETTYRARRVKIKTVSFRANIQVRPFESVHIEATADVPTGETAGHTLDLLKEFVQQELRRAKEGEVPAERVGRFRV